MADTTIPIKLQLSDFMKLLYRKGEENGWSEGTPLRTVANELGLPMGLVVKISKYLEHSKMLEYENGTVDLTVDGIMRVQEAMVVPTPIPVPVPPAKNGTKTKAVGKKTK